MNSLRYILGYLLLVFVSCNVDRKPPFDEVLIQIISENPIYSGNPEIIPIEYAVTTFFVQGDSGKILLLAPREFEEIYREDYSSWKYEKFVRKALNQELIIKNRKGETFELDKEVTDNYSNNNFIYFMELYCEHSSKDQYKLKNNVPVDQEYSVFYYAFINNYLTSFDDHIGIYYLSKTSKFTGEKFREE